MKKLNTILSILSLALTSFLLTLVVFAWYVTNKTANVKDASGNIADIEDIVDYVEYFNFVGVENNTYTVRHYVKDTHGDNADKTQMRFHYNEDRGSTAILDGDLSGNQGYNQDNVGSFIMNRFDYEKSDYSKYLIKVTLKPGKRLSNLQFISDAKYFIGFDKEPYDGSLINVSSLSMSSVIKFGYLATNPIISNDKKTVTFDDSGVTYRNFEYTHNSNYYYGAITNEKISLVTNLNPVDDNTPVTFSILVDYNKDAVDAFYSYNLSCYGEWSPQTPEFKELDYRIFILG